MHVIPKAQPQEHIPRVNLQLHKIDVYIRRVVNAWCTYQLGRILIRQWLLSEVFFGGNIAGLLGMKQLCDVYIRRWWFGVKIWRQILVAEKRNSNFSKQPGIQPGLKGQFSHNLRTIQLPFRLYFLIMKWRKKFVKILVNLSSSFFSFPLSLLSLSLSPFLFPLPPALKKVELSILGYHSQGMSGSNIQAWVYVFVFLWMSQSETFDQFVLMSHEVENWTHT